MCFEIYRRNREIGTLHNYSTSGVSSKFILSTIEEIITLLIAGSIAGSFNDNVLETSVPETLGASLSLLFERIKERRYDKE